MNDMMMISTTWPELNRSGLEAGKYQKMLKVGMDGMKSDLPDSINSRTNGTTTLTSEQQIEYITMKLIAEIMARKGMARHLELIGDRFA